MFRVWYAHPSGYRTQSGVPPIGHICLDKSCVNLIRFVLEVVIVVAGRPPSAGWTPRFENMASQARDVYSVVRDSRDVVSSRHRAG